LTRQKAGEILTELPVEIRNEVISRIATLDGIPPEALTEVNISLSKLLLKDDSQRGLGGVRPAAEILNFLGTEVSDNVMQYVANIDEELSQQIKDEMFIFDDIIKIRDRDMEIVLQQISSEGLVTALKGVSDALRDKFLNNMSRRAGDLLREDLEAKGPVKLSEVEKQQREILAVVTGLLGAGTISVMSEGDEEEFI
jgi:flagellar motor switch protein FliG